MPEIRGRTDDALDAVSSALESYERERPEAEIAVYRQNAASVRVGVIDPGSKKSSRTDRHDAVWACLEALPENVLSQISMLLALAPSETEESFANHQFDHPVPSQLL